MNSSSISAHPTGNALSVEEHAGSHVVGREEDTASQLGSSRSLSSSPVLSGLTSSTRRRSRSPVSVNRMPRNETDKSGPVTSTGDGVPILQPQPVLATPTRLLSELGGYRVSSPTTRPPSAPSVTSTSAPPSFVSEPSYSPPLSPPSGYGSTRTYTPPPGPPPGFEGKPNYPAPSGPPPGHESAPVYPPPPGHPPSFEHPAAFEAPHQSFEPSMVGAPPIFGAPPGRPPSKASRWSPQHMIGMMGQAGDIVLSLTNALLQLLVKWAHKMEELSRK